MVPKKKEVLYMQLYGLKILLLPLGATIFSNHIFLYLKTGAHLLISGQAHAARPRYDFSEAISSG